MSRKQTMKAASVSKKSVSASVRSRDQKPASLSFSALTNPRSISAQFSPATMGDNAHAQTVRHEVTIGGNLNGENYENRIRSLHRIRSPQPPARRATTHHRNR